MTLFVGPAVGARGQIGFAEEGGWGKQVQNMTGFLEMLSESIVSEIAPLISGSLRPDRAVHKRTQGTEACGGDISAEIAPKGFETWFKHALGEVETTRLDTAFVIELTDPSETGAKLEITHTADLATRLQITLDVGANLDLDLTNASYDTIAEVMTAINAHANLAAYSPYQLTQDVLQTSLHTSDYCVGTDNSNRLEECNSVELTKVPNRRWVVGTSWGVYSHEVKCAATLPEGLSIEAGRDVAAFLYSGMKVNTMELTANPSEIVNGTFGMMGKGGTTADTPSAASANMNSPKNAFRVRYSGEQSSCSLAVDSTNYTLTLEIDGTAEDVVLGLKYPYVDPETGIVHNVDKIGGLVKYLNSKSYLNCYLGGYVDPKTLSIYLNHYPAVTLSASDYTWFNFNMGNIVSLPVLWGDYIGSDIGDSKKFYIKVVTGGVPGTAMIQFKIEGGAYGNTVTTSATVPSEIRYNANVDSGYTIFFPDNTVLVADDVWTFETIRPSSLASYPTVDPFSGFEGTLTMDGSSQSIMGWSCNVNNNLYGDKYHLGDKTRAKLMEQRREVGGTLNVEFDDLDLYRKFINGTSVDIQIVFVSSEYISTTALGNSPTQYSMTVRQPNVEFNGTTPTNSDEGIILVDMPYVAMWDDTLALPELILTIVSNEAYV